MLGYDWMQQMITPTNNRGERQSPRVLHYTIDFVIFFSNFAVIFSPPLNTNISCNPGIITSSGALQRTSFTTTNAITTIIYLPLLLFTYNYYYLH